MVDQKIFQSLNKFSINTKASDFSKALKFKTL